eukprot:1011310-Rhodomonas_salina.1
MTLSWRSACELRSTRTRVLVLTASELSVLTHACTCRSPQRLHSGWQCCHRDGVPDEQSCATGGASSGTWSHSLSTTEYSGYTLKSNTRNRIIGTCCTENADSGVGFRGVLVTSDEKRENSALAVRSVPTVRTKPMTTVWRPDRQHRTPCAAHTDRDCGAHRVTHTA